MINTLMKKDKFVFYSSFLNMLIAGIGTWLAPAEYQLMVVCIMMIGGFGLFIMLLDKAMENPIKLWTPVPVYLNDEWCFIYYLTEGSEMISKTEMLHRKLIS